MRAKTGVLVACIGNRHRGDDAAGPRVIDLLRQDPPPEAHFAELDGDAAELIEALEGADAAIAVDAVRSGSEAGTIHRFDVERQALPTRFFRYSTHAFGLAEAIETARALGRLPRRTVVYGIEGRDFEPGLPLTGPVEGAAREVSRRIREQLRVWRTPSPPGGATP